MGKDKHCRGLRVLQIEEQVVDILEQLRLAHYNHLALGHHWKTLGGSDDGINVALKSIIDREVEIALNLGK